MQQLKSVADSQTADNLFDRMEIFSSEVRNDEFEITYKKFKANNLENTIRFTSFGRTWIPVENLDALIEDLNAIGFVCHSSPEGFDAHHRNNEAIINFTGTPKGMGDGKCFHTYKNADTIKKVIDAHSDNSKKLNIRWITDADGNYYDLVDIADELTTDSMYPFVTEGVDAYVERFMKSKSTILILIGEPGTGKTNFIRNILSTVNKRAHITFNENVFNTDEAFANFVSSQYAGVFVVEDADLLLRKREAGNPLMAKFLNIGDGIIKLQGKKMIFSTNLPSTNDIDDAIMRPGRCFDVLKFEKLTFQQALEVCEDHDLEPVTEDRRYTLTEIFNRKKVSHEKVFGFR